jgi:hypothetical protein
MVSFSAPLSAARRLFAAAFLSLAFAGPLAAANVESLVSVDWLK